MAETGVDGPLEPVEPLALTLAAGAADGPPNDSSGASSGASGVGRLAGLDGLRAIAVLAVVVYHADLGWLPGGFLGVDVFFVISGFLITTLLLAERERLGRIELRAFWLRRARRLLPALFLVLASTLTLSVVWAPDEVARLRSDTLAALGYATNWYLIARQQSYFEAVGRPSPLLHLWSLAVEEQFYVLWPLLLTAGLMVLRRRGMLLASLLGALGSALLMAWLYEPGADPSRVYYGTDTHAAGLLLGAALALAWTPSAGSRPRISETAGGARLSRWRARVTWWDALGGVALLALGGCFVAFDEYQPLLYRGGFVALGLVTMAVIVAAVHPSSHFGRSVLDRRPLRWIGERSYGIYLWHWPIFTLTRPQLDVAPDPLPDLALRLALTLMAAELSYRFVETPVRHGALGRAWRAWRLVPRRRRLATYRWPLASGTALLAVALLVGARVAGATPPSPPPYLSVVSVDVGAPTAAPSAAPPSATGTAATTTGSSLTAGGGTAAGLAGQGAAPSDTPSARAPGAPGANGPGASPAASGPAAAPSAPPAAAQRPPAVLAVGDSVMLGAVTELLRAIPGIEVNAAIGRSFDVGLQILRQRQHEGLLPNTVVIGLGDNGWITSQQVDQALQLLGSTRRVVFVNLKEPRSWESHDNAVLAAAAARDPRVVLADWYAASIRHPEYFWDDGIHLRPAGAAAYARLLAAALAPPPVVALPQATMGATPWPQASETPAPTAATTPLASATPSPASSGP